METAKSTDPGGDRAPGLFAGAAALAAVAAALLAAFFPSLRALELVWHDPNFSHGYFVAPIALAIAWNRRDGLDAARLDPRWWGILPLLGLAGVRVWLYAKNEQYIEQATFPLFVAASTLADSCAPGCGRSRRTITREPAGHEPTARHRSVSSTTCPLERALIRPGSSAAIHPAPGVCADR